MSDRSDGPALIRSLYNAINRKEYARAYSYFADQKRFADYQSFVEGYAKTVDVQVITGTVTPRRCGGKHLRASAGRDQIDGRGWQGAYFRRLLRHPHCQRRDPGAALCAAPYRERRTGRGRWTPGEGLAEGLLSALVRGKPIRPACARCPPVCRRGIANARKRSPRGARRERVRSGRTAGRWQVRPEHPLDPFPAGRQ